MKTQKTNNDKPDLSFEEAMSRLDEIVKILDEGKLSLDDTLVLYEEGINLYRRCSNLLDKTEQRVSILGKNDSGKYEEFQYKDLEVDKNGL
ncbi:exodeoxyribonuclease VII small subunit [Anaerosolibacter sp.]|uniref:exodeoxyribonuclease VII small subunit n=1 Tax=Anaerosolibacter sp. TaxID=1872527 RepID=UPI0026313CAF|nr:exodeoxyribonuclease VII small subunit [Anaerosolibacter sp.]MDF2546462.1 exodeoxyribonuclease small subunit [Anaerosolibacter sp.]